MFGHSSCSASFSQFLSIDFFTSSTQPTTATLFPYTTLFRSAQPHAGFRCRDLANHGRERLRATPRASRCRRKLAFDARAAARSEEHTSELQSHSDLVCRLLLEKKKIEMLDFKLMPNLNLTVA